MAEEIGVNVKIDVTNSQRILADLSRQLQFNDKLIAQLKKNGISWADSFTKKIDEAKERIEVLGLTLFNHYKQGKPLLQNHIKKLEEETKKVAKLTELYEKMRSATTQYKFGKSNLLNISKEPITAHLRDPFKKQKQAEANQQLKNFIRSIEDYSSLPQVKFKLKERERQQYFEKAQQQYLKFATRQQRILEEQKKKELQIIKRNNKLLAKEIMYNTALYNKAKQERLKTFIGSLKDTSLADKITPKISEQKRQEYFEKAQQQYLKFATKRQKEFEKQLELKRKAIRKNNEFIAKEIMYNTALYRKAKQDNLRAFITSLKASDISENRVLASLGGEKANKNLKKYLVEQERLIRKQNKERGETGDLTSSLTRKERRLTSEYLAQLRIQNKFKYAKELMKQTFRETISLANILNVALRTTLYNFVNNFAGRIAQNIGEISTLASDFIGYKNALAIASGSQAEATKRMQDAVKIALELRLSVISVVKEYSKFINATTLAGLSVRKGTEIFKDYAIAARVLNLNQERTSSMFLALEQMVSKGTVSMEELRRQLGDHLPGALNLAATAMGYSKEEMGTFIKAVSQGKVKSLELVTALGKLVKTKTEPFLGDALEKYTAKIQHLENALTLLKEKLGLFIGYALGAFAEWGASAVFSISKIFPVTSTLKADFDEVGNVLVAAEGTLQDWSSDVLVASNNTQQLNKEFKNLTLEAALAESNMSLMSQTLVGFLGLTAIKSIAASLSFLKKPLNFVFNAFKALFTLKVAQKFYKLGNAIGWIIDILKNGSKYLMIGRIFLASMGPVGWAITAFTTLTGIFFSLTSSSEAAQNILKNYDKVLAKATSAVDTFNQKLDEYLTKASRVKNEAAIDKIVSSKNELDRIKAKILALAKRKQELMASLGTIDSFLMNRGLYTGDAKRILEATHTITKVIEAYENYRQSLETNLNATTLIIDQQITAIDTLIEKYTEWNNRSEEYLIDVKLNILTLDDDKQQEILTRFKAAQRIARRIANESKSRSLQRSDIDKITQEELAKVEKEILLLKRTKAIKDAKKSINDFNSSFKSLFETLSSGAAKERQAQQELGKTSYEVERLRLEYEQQTLAQKIAKLEAKALTVAQKAQIQTLKEALSVYINLKAKTIQQKQAEEERKKTLADLTEEQNKFNQLRQQGFNLIKEFLPVEQQYALAIEKIDEALKAYGATAEQIKKVHRKIWKDTLANAKETYLTLEDVTRQVAEKLETHFSDFFFDIMQGKFDLMSNSFKQALDRMVADAMATNLAEYIMGKTAPNGSFEGIIGSVASSLFGVNKTAAPPQMTGGTITTDTAMSFINSSMPDLLKYANGGEFIVGGNGGVDSQLVMFKASPNEKVTISTPQQQKQARTKSQVINITMNIQTQNADSFMASKAQILNDLKMQIQNAGRMS